MRYLIALLVPFISFFTIGKPIAAILCVILQLTLISWPIAAIWAVVSVGNYYADKRTDRLIEGLRK